MTDEERERTMDFILSQQAKFSTDIDRLKESDDEIRRLLAEHLTRYNEHLTRYNEQAELSAMRATYTSNAISALFESQERMSESQERTNQDVRNLTAVVNRIADAVAVLIDRDNAANNGK